jgi:preprotein translocase subunit SecD
MPALRCTLLGWMMLCISTALLGCLSQLATAPNIPFSIRVVDESTDVATRRVNADLVPNFKDGGSVWLKREGAIEGPFVVEAHTGSVEGERVVLFTLTPEAADRFASLTRANIGHRIAMVVNGKVVVNTLVAGEAPRNSLQFSGNFTEAEARTIAANMRASAAR